MEILRLYAPIIALEVLLKVVALWDLAHRTDSQVKFRKKWVWVILIIAITAIGSVGYLAWGRDDSGIE